MNDHPFLGRAFRPFFLGAGLHGCFVVAAWTAIALGALPAPVWLSPAAWHAHEMLFGLVAAAVAGFILTAAPVWTGRPALSGRPLAALFAFWVLGRLAMLAAGVLPARFVAAIDGAFLVAVAAVLERTLWGTGQLRNHGIAAVVGALALANAVVHARALGFDGPPAPTILRFAADCIVVLIVVIGGRITPSFTANALARMGDAARPASRPWLDRLAVASVALLAATDLVAPRGLVSGLLAGMGAAAVGARLAGWQTLRILRDPLVWSLHAGTAWVALGLVLVAAGDLGRVVPADAGLHALTAGAMGAMILAVMTRVALGHTGRPLVLPRGAVWCYALVSAGAAARVLAPLSPGGARSTWVLTAGALWASGFGLYALLYAPILVRPRVDGRPG